MSQAAADLPPDGWKIRPKTSKDRLHEPNLLKPGCLMPNLNRTDASKVIGPIMKHPVPPRTGWMYVFGSATLFAFLIQDFTGIALATAYVSSAGQAFESL